FSLYTVAPPPRSTLFPYTTLFRSYAFFRALVGDEGFGLLGAPITAIANLQMPGDACELDGPAPGDSALAALDNAFFAPDGFFPGDRKSTRLNSSHVKISYAVFCLK